MAAAVTVRLSSPQIDTASINVVTTMMTSAGRKATAGEIYGIPGMAHNASQVATSPATKKPSDPSSVRVLV